MGRTSEAQKIESNLSKYGRRKCSTTASVSKFYILQILPRPETFSAIFWKGIGIQYFYQTVLANTGTFEFHCSIGGGSSANRSRREGGKVCEGRVFHLKTRVGHGLDTG